MITAPVVFTAFLGGLLPALLWLVFWQLEDHCDPEPKKLIILSFVAGMVVVPLVLPFQHIVQSYLPTISALTFFLWAAIEELFKFAAAWIVILRNRAVDEPIDAIVYMITVSLGFAALENTLFLLRPDSPVNDLLLTGSQRFIGSTLLHTLASATIGIALALAFYKSKKKRTIYLTGGIALAIALHTLFNVIIMSGGNGFAAFLFVWIGVIVVLLFFERLKRPARDYC
jgi:RsiW-degrading membrane proteinase PrsW (M82 family)